MYAIQKMNSIIIDLVYNFYPIVSLEVELA